LRWIDSIAFENYLDETRLGGVSPATLLGFEPTPPEIECGRGQSSFLRVGKDAEATGGLVSQYGGIPARKLFAPPRLDGEIDFSHTPYDLMLAARFTDGAKLRAGRLPRL
jgi:hypothetical protein